MLPVADVLQAAYMPQGHCYLWSPGLLWLHVGSDALIGLAYFSISTVLAVYARRRPDVSHRWILWMFAAFILFCGATHFFQILTVWRPDYWLEGTVKAGTALVSVATAVMLWPLLPRVLALPTPGQLNGVNAELRQEIERRRLTEEQLREANEHLEEKVRQRTAALERLANTDELSGLFNRRHFRERLEEEVARARRRNERPPSVILIDLDNFKDVNDGYGHTMGDAVIARVGTLIGEVVREGDVAARYGGDEFCILTTGARSANAHRVATRLQDRIRRELSSGPGGQSLHVTCSVGVVEPSDRGTSARELLALADRALYTAKDHGKDTVIRTA